MIFHGISAFLEKQLGKTIWGKTIERSFILEKQIRQNHLGQNY